MNTLKLVPMLGLLLVGSAVAGTPINETRPLAADAIVEVENVAGSIRVRGTATTELRVTGELGDGVEGLRIEGDGQRLSVKVQYPNESGPRGWWGGQRVADSQIVLEVPQGVELRAQSVSASVTVAGVSGRRAAIETVSGAVEFDGGPQALEIESVSGSLQVTATGIAEVALESVSGAIELDGAITERLRAESVSGRIRISSDQPLAKVQSSAVSGDIDLQVGLAGGGQLNAESLSGTLAVTLPAATSARITASSFSGSIRSDVGEVEKESFGPGSSLRTTLGDGAGEVRLESFSGTVRLKLQ